MEPTTNMYHQQGWLSAIDSYIKGDPHLLRRIDLEHASKNAVAAWKGSMDGRIATIDLSSASDSVSLALVNQWFRNTNLYLPMMATRSDRTQLPDGTVWPLKKFASMGSALCFPIECIVFAAVCEASVMECGHDPVTSMYRVYGDDIVIESQYADTVVERLTQNGFTINLDKSFTRRGIHNFRESCGGHYLDGEDVTPIYLSRFYLSSREGRTRSKMSSYVLQRVELANGCYGRLPLTRRWCLLTLRHLPNSLRVPFVDLLTEWGDQNNTGLISHKPTNHHLMSSGLYSDDDAVLTHGTSIVRHTPEGEENGAVGLYEALRGSPRHLPNYNQLETLTIHDIISIHHRLIRERFVLEGGSEMNTNTYPVPKWVSVTTPRWLL